MANIYLIGDAKDMADLQTKILGVFPKEDALRDPNEVHTIFYEAKDEDKEEEDYLTNENSFGREFFLKIFFKVKESRLSKRYAGVPLESYLREASKSIRIPFIFITGKEAERVSETRKDFFVNFSQPGWEKELRSATRSKIGEYMKGFVNEAYTVFSFKDIGQVSFHLNGHDIKVSDIMYTSEDEDRNGYDFIASMVGITKTHKPFYFGVKSSSYGLRDSYRIPQLIIGTIDDDYKGRIFPPPIRVMEGLARMYLAFERGEPVSVIVTSDGKIKEIKQQVPKAA